MTMSNSGIQLNVIRCKGKYPNSSNVDASTLSQYLLPSQSFLCSRDASKSYRAIIVTNRYCSKAATTITFNSVM